jgi:outer membrane protein
MHSLKLQMMKRLMVMMAIFMLPALTFAQNKAKFGHLNYGDVIKEIPGVDTAQKAIEEFQAELQSVGEAMSNELQTKYQAYQQLQATASAAILKVKEDEIRGMYERLQNYQESVQADLQKRQMELLKPFQDKLLQAIKEVAKAENFTYIFDTSTLTYYEQGEDIAAKVKTKLGIK